MNETELIGLIRQEVEAAAPSATVRTDGNGGEVSDDLPAVIIDWDTDPISTGHTPFKDYKTDSSGDEIGKILGKLYAANFSFVIKSRSEAEKDSIANEIQRQFIPYEENSDAFHSDTAEWDVGGIQPRTLQQVEPDWYEALIQVSHRFQKIVETSGETLTGTNNTINTS